MFCLSSCGKKTDEPNVSNHKEPKHEESEIPQTSEEAQVIQEESVEDSRDKTQIPQNNNERRFINDPIIRLPVINPSSPNNENVSLPPNPPSLPTPGGGSVTIPPIIPPILPPIGGGGSGYPYGGGGGPAIGIGTGVGGGLGVGGGYGNNNMTAVNTMFPGITCSLIDNRPHQDLLKAVENLSNSLKISIGECENNSDFRLVQNKSQGLISAAQVLKNYWLNPESLTLDQLNSFEANLQTALVGIDEIGQILTSNRLLNSKCGKKMMSFSGIINDVSDLVTSIAPYALMGVSINPALTPAIPYVLGITGAAAVGKLVTQDISQNSIQIDKPLNRKAILTNVCEFAKISQKVRFLKLAQSGQIELLTKEINELKIKTYKSLTFNKSQYLFTLINIRNEIENDLNKYQTKSWENQRTFLQIEEDLRINNDSTYTCNLVKALASRVTDDEVFPGNILFNFNNLIKKHQQGITLAQSVLLETEFKVRSALLKNKESLKPKDVAECSNLSSSYLSSLKALLLGSNGYENTINKLKFSLYNSLSKNSEFKNYRKDEVKINTEIAILEKIAKILNQLNLDNSVIDKSELHMQMAQVKQSLFNSTHIFGYAYGTSPVYAWLRYIHKQFISTINQFSVDMNAITVDAFLITKTGKMNIYKTDEKGNIIRDKYGVGILLTGAELDRSFLEDLENSAKLNNLTYDFVNKDPEQKKYVCQRLENIWLLWAAAIDHLSAENFFCRTIKEFFDSNVESEIINHCEDGRTLFGLSRKKSIITESFDKLKKKGRGSRSISLSEQALIVSAKMKELKCEMPDPVASTQ